MFIIKIARFIIKMALKSLHKEITKSHKQRSLLAAKTLKDNTLLEKRLEEVESLKESLRINHNAEIIKCDHKRRALDSKATECLIITEKLKNIGL